MLVVVLSFVWFWLDMSDMDYYENAPMLGFSTAGWFSVGFVFLGVFAIAFAAIASLVARYSTIAAWSGVIVIFVLLIYFSALNGQVLNRLSSVLNIDTTGIDVRRLKQADSFNDGTTTVAIFAGNKALFQKICDVNNLKPKRATDKFWLRWFPSEYPERTDEIFTIYENEGLTCYHDGSQDEVHIYHHPRD